MYPMKNACCLASAAMFALCCPVVVAAAEVDVKQGEEKSQVCVACHGEKGISQQDNYPHLHGQRQTYLLRQMRTFRDGGDRRDPIMTPMLENMSDQDLRNLAAYYSSFGKVLGTETDTRAEQSVAAPMASPEIEGPAETTEGEADASPETAAEGTPVPVPATPAPAPATASAATGDAAAGETKAAACAACHGADGHGTAPLFPNLAGQKPEYLALQLKAFRDGGRTDPTMAPMAMALSDEDIADLAAFYSGLK